MANFCYTDIHCHPNLKTFGHSFDKKANRKSDIWQRKSPTYFTKLIHKLTGISKFSQTDFTTMAKAKAKIIFVSLYPFEKGFFFNPYVPTTLAAFLANWAIEIGYYRVRYLQSHTDYFKDLLNEYNFVLTSPKQKMIDGEVFSWQLTNNWNDVKEALNKVNHISVVLTIEGAHVFNTGLGEYGKPLLENEILTNIQLLKQWKYVPVFLGLAHNFNNDLCGHARSLQRLGNIVNQQKNLNAGLSDLGAKAIHALLSNKNGRRIYIDLKHMSLASRKDYYTLLKNNYADENIPLIVSHGAVNGLSLKENNQSANTADIFNSSDLNFYDEEVIEIAKSEGLFAIQFDFGNNADISKAKRNFLHQHNDCKVSMAALIIWNQLQYIATLLDRNGLFAWGCICIGSDFDGSINPFPDLLTAADFEQLSSHLEILANKFITSNSLSISQNKAITSNEIVERFMYTNAMQFLQKYY